MEERRRHVRAKPSPELPARVLADIMPGITEALDVVDISISGLAIMQGSVEHGVGTTVALRLVLSDVTVPFQATVRWAAKGMVGLELLGPPEETTKVVQRYVGELLERGG